jgi:pimeloyl-ACP methyl ester carboxylesterase
MLRPKAYTSQVVTSGDGTQIGYRQLGRGEGVVLIHGGLQASQNFMKLANHLSDNFTVYIPDRRGRGMSGPYGENYSIQRDCEDVNAILHKTGAHYLFGLSSGALISLYAALDNTGIQKLAIYEPPLSDKFPTFTRTFIDRYERELAAGKLAAAFVTVMKGLQVSGILSMLPRFITVPLFKFALSRTKESKKEEVTLMKLIPTFHFDNMLVDETAGSFEKYKALTTETLLINGSKSPNYLKDVIVKLRNILPNVKHVELKGLDHLAADDSGKPETVAAVLNDFLKTK